MDDDLLERDEARDLLVARFAAAAEGRGSVVLAEAGPGLGKTRLLAAAARWATEAGLQPLTARGHELERHFPHGVVRQLLERPVLDLTPEDRTEVVDGAAAAAVPLLVSGEPPAPDEARLAHGLFWTVANLAARQPLALLVDDAQWADPATDRVLHYLSARIADLPVALVVARRPDVPTEVPPLQAVPGVHALTLDRLSSQGIGCLVRRHLPDADEALTSAVEAVTNGNPLLVTQVVAAAGDLTDLDADPGDLDDAMAAVVGHRLAGLAPDAVATLQALGILGGTSALADVAAVADLSPATVRAQLPGLVDLALLTPLGDGPLQIVHGAIRRAIEDHLAPDARRTLHERAARVLIGRGAPAPVVAPHLMPQPPAGRAEVARVLHEAGRQALDAGDSTAALAMLRRARAEPPPSRLIGVVLADLTRAAAASRDPSWRHHVGALRAHQPPEELATTLRRLGHALLGAGDLSGAAATFREALALDGADPDTRLATLAALGFAARQDPEVRATVDEALAAVLDRSDGDTTAAERALLAVGAYEASRRAAPGAAAVVDLARRATAVPEGADSEITRGPGFLLATLCLTLGDDWERATAAADRALEVAARRGNAVTFAAASTYRARAAFHTGRIDEAIAHADAGLDAGRELWGLDLPGTIATLAMALIEQGDLARAETALVLPDGPAWPESPGYDLWLTARCDLRVAQDRAADSLADAELVVSRRGAPDDNPSTIRWRSTLARARAAHGDRSEAAGLVDEEIVLARTFGAPRALAAALRTRALLEADAGDRLALLEEAHALLEGTDTRLERIRVQLALGRTLRHLRRPTDARDPLRAALHDAEAGGARLLAEAARQELHATGARPRRAALTGPASLTPSEQRIARLAAEGLTNREIAERLFVSVKTVEYHLANAYPKLGVRRRADLAALLDRA